MYLSIINNKIHETDDIIFGRPQHKMPHEHLKTHNFTHQIFNIIFN